MQTLKDFDLTDYNTFGINAKAKFLVEINKEADFLELLETTEYKNNQKLFLGGGSNMLLVKDFDGLIVLNKLKGIEIIKEDEENVWVKAMGGEIWNDLVLFSVEKGFWGLENLSLVPGTVGASPVQNIGAYGSEAKDTIFEVEAIDIKNAGKKVFTNKECEFGYRDSIFKNKLKGKYFIIAVIFKLSKKQNKNVNYRALQEYLDENKLEIKSSGDVARIIAEIRESKLPNPKILGNAGSFFKNVYVDIDKLLEIELLYPDVPCFEEENRTSPLTPLLNKERGNQTIKIPTAWLIEKCGWKGKRVGNVGVHIKQSLVLVNYGGATGAEVLDLANKIIDSVDQKFGIKLTLEVNLI